MLKSCRPSNCLVTRPLNPNRNRIEIAPTNGGEMIGSNVSRCSARLKGTLVRVRVNAITNPSVVPTTPTSAATWRLFESAAR